jgi:cytochrome c553/cytochrome c5
MKTLVRAIAALGLVFVAWLLGGSRSREEVVRAPIVRLVVKHPWLTAGAMAAAAVVVAALGVISGVVPIGASSGHWRITAVFLDFAKTRSVWTHSWGVTAPALDDESLVLRGAAHYENACLPCHGGPGRSVPAVMGAMTPPPPELSRRIPRWRSEELFSIVKHGIKFTGMPAWPVQQRDDEVWAMVAFLRRMPGIDPAAYRRLAYGGSNGEPSPDLPRPGDDPPPRAVRDVCWRCHGVNGTGRSPGAFPSLAGQRSAYLYASLRAFRERTRFSGIMGEVAARLSDDEMRESAVYYENLPSRESEAPGDEASMTQGRSIATRGLPERDIPACVECHGPTAYQKNPAYPKLAAQHAGYLMSQLSLLQAHNRGGTRNVNLMHVFVNRLRPNEIRDVARFYAALPGIK